MFDGQFKRSSAFGKMVLQQMKTLEVGGLLETRLLPAIPETIRWTCVEKHDDKMRLSGRFCDIPLMNLEISLTDDVVSLKVIKGVE